MSMKITMQQNLLTKLTDENETEYVEATNKVLLQRIVSTHRQYFLPKRLLSIIRQSILRTIASIEI